MHKQIRIFFLATLLPALFGCGGKNTKTGNEEKIFPTENFSVVEVTMTNGKPGIGSFNFAYKNYDRKSEYPWCLKIAIALKVDSLFENGLPKDSESKIANELENELLAEIKKLATAHYVGHLFNDTFLDIYIYLDGPEKAHKYLQAQVNKEGLSRGFRYEIKKDPTWATVNEFVK